MSFPAKILAASLLSLVIGCATGPSSETYDSPLGKWTEHWETSGGVTRVSRFTIFDENSGKYRDSYNSRVEFFATDGPLTWKGYWINDGAGMHSCNLEKGGSKSWGESVFHFNETYSRYKGTWDFCGEGRKFNLSGVR